MSEDRTLSYPDPDRGAPPGHFGPYRLLRLLGEGGMGEVWEAEQEAPVRRRVAIKVIKPGMDSKQVLARFETERQALALMSHPGIATVFDAGTTELGRPFFVMELVRGLPITQYCDRERLSTERRLQLLLAVCEGVQHAHQKGIIHRDLKPSNILVTEENHRPVAKIIDFGVAKATGQRLSEETVYTQLGAWIGTPEYMSPEQAEASGLDVDTRTDVYSLGALLYELLVGTGVHDRETLRSLGFDEMRRLILEREPPRPSTRLTGLGAAGKEVAHRRETDPTALAKQLRGDLDWIVMKALEKERARRYGSVTELAADIDRHLRHEPVLARPPSQLYRARKFVRRHRVAVAFGSLALVTLVAFSITTAFQAKRVERERDRANAEAQTARQVSSFFIELFQLVNPDEARGSTVTVREVLDRGAARIERELESQPAVRARLRETFGNVYIGLGLYRDAIPHLEEAVAQARSEGGDTRLVTALLDLSSALMLADRLGEAEEAALEALARSRATTPADELASARARHRLGVIYTQAGRFEEARTELEAALRARQREPRADPEGLAATHAAMASLHHHLEENGQARAHLERALDIRERSLGPDHPDTVTTLCNVAQVLSQTGDPGATAAFERCLTGQERVLGPDHPGLARTLNNMAIATFPTDPEASRALFERSLDVRLRTLGPNHADVAESLNNLGYVHYAAGELDAARERYRAALEIWERALGPEHLELGEVLTNLGQLELQRGDVAAAERYIERAVEVRQKSAPETTELAHSLALLGRTQTARGNWQEAEAAFLSAVAIYEARIAAGFFVVSNLRTALSGLSELYEAWGRPEDASAVRDRRDRLAEPAAAQGS